MKFFRYLFLFSMMAGSLNLQALDIFIAPGGNDENTGTRENPLLTLQGAVEHIRQIRRSGAPMEEVRIIVTNGTYPMNAPLVLTEADSGTGDAPVVFMAEEGAEPVFLGGMRIGGWEKAEGNLWKANIPEVRQYGFYFEQLFVDGQRAQRAKSPNEGFYYLKGVEETVVSEGEGRVPEMAVQTLELFPEAAADFSTFTPADFNDAIVTLYHKWDNTRKRVSGFDASRPAIFTTGKGMKPWNRLDPKTRFTIENYRAALDSPGEWFLEKNGDLFYYPAEGQNPNQSAIFAPVVQRFIELKGNPETGEKVEHIGFENLRFQVAGYRTPPSGNEPAQAASPVEAVVMADYAREIHFRNCEIAHTGTNAFWFQKACADCSVTHCYLHDLGAGGIKIGERQIPENESDLTKRIIVDNNIIRSGGHVFACAVGVIIFQASDNAITQNDIADFRYSGVSVGWVWGYSHSPAKRNTVEYNHIHHIGWGELSDMGGVYCLGESEGTSVSNNVIHHVYSYDYGGWGLYTDEGSTGIVMENNLVYACKNAGFHQHYGKENTIRNNIFAGNIRAQLMATRIEDHLSFRFVNNIVWFDSGSLLRSNWSKVNLFSDNNCYWDTRTRDIRFGEQTFEEWQAAGKDTHSIVADPQFTDPDNGDFTINNASVIEETGFSPFDYTRAGVYGSEAWVNKAAIDPGLTEKFDEMVRQMESRD